MKNKQTKSIFSSLENFSSTPPPELWANIEAELDKPKKKKRPIIWWWAAACLMAGLSLPTVWYLNSNQDNNQKLNLENNVNDVVLQNKSNDNIKVNKNINEEENTISLTSSNKNVTNVNTAKENLNTGNHISLGNSNLATAKTITEISSETVGRKRGTDSKGETNDQLIAQSGPSQSDAIVGNKNVTTRIYNPVSGIGLNTFSIKNNSNGNAIAVVSSPDSTISEAKQNDESVKNPNSKSATANYGSEVSGFNNNINNKAIAENVSTHDSLSVIKKEVAQLESALADLGKDKTKKKTSPKVTDKWSLEVFAGVMGSENYNNEKALGNTVASKQSNGYGVKTNYKLNKKWAVSSGFKINELGQKIDDVAYYERGSLSSFTSGILSNTILQEGSSKNNNIVFVSNNENYLFAENSNASTGFETGNVTQNLKYFEMPLEVSYALLSKKKTSISMNTGGFVGKLISNEVLLNGNSIGENKNVNEYVYGTLLSSTLQYEIYKKTNFFIEPGMNYYINPLENQSFNQFQWMFNVGVNVSF